MAKVLLGAAALLLAVVAIIWIANATARGSYGMQDGSLAPCPSKPNCVSSVAEDESHRVSPFQYDSHPDAALSQIRAAVGAMPGAQLAESGPNYLRYTFTSRFCRFVDDVEFLADENAKVIQVRSASRVGYSDLGVNRQRVETIRAKLGEGGS